MNIDNPERIVRVIVGLGVLAILAFSESKWRWLGLFGLIPLLTGLVGWCPLYAWITQD